MEFGIIVEKNPVRNKVLLGKGDIETVLPLPTKHRAWTLDFGGIVVWVNCEDRISINGDGLPGNGDHIRVLGTQGSPGKLRSMGPKDPGLIKCKPHLLGHQKKIGSLGHYLTHPCELWM